MANKVTVWLKAAYLGYLGKISGRAVTGVSPLNVPGPELSASDIEELKKNGVLGASGAVADGFRPALDCLAGATAFTRTRLTRGRGLLEYVVYFAPDGTTCSLLTENDGFTLEYPAGTAEFVPFLEELMGTSTLRNVEFETELNIIQGRALAAAVDLSRKAMLKSLAEGSDSINAQFSPEDIAEWLEKKTNDAQWLSSVVKGLIPTSDYELSAVIDALEKLVQNDLLIKESTRFTLNEQAATLASRFLIVDKLFSLRAGTNFGVDVTQIGFICLSAGVNDLLMIEADENKIYMETTSARQVMEYAKHLLNEAFKPVQNAAPASVTALSSAAQTAVICKTCGAQLSDKAKFCNSCGNSIKTSPAFCGSCGAVIKEGSRFCGGCGTPC